MKVKTFYAGDHEPRYSTIGSAGMDVFTNFEFTIKPMECKTIPLELYMEIPHGHCIDILSKSGLSSKHQIIALNAPGLIDSDYRENMGVILMNLSGKDYTFKKGDKIAQIRMLKVETIELDHVDSKDELSITERNGGYGSTGR